MGHGAIVSQPAADSTSLVGDAAARILRDVADPQTLNNAKDDGWKKPAWKALQDAGLAVAWVPDTLGGAGAGLADGFAVLREAGRFALPLPLAETLLAGWLLSRASISSPEGAMTCAPTRPGDIAKVADNGTVSGRLRAVPMARDAAHLAVLARRGDGRHAVALIDAKASSIAEGESMAGDALNAVTLNGVRPIELMDANVDEDALLMMGAAARAIEMAGALEAALDLAVGYANERVAFERKIAKFQAVQHNLARLAGEVAVAVAAATSAADAIATTGFPLPPAGRGQGWGESRRRRERRSHLPRGRLGQDPRRRGGHRRCRHRASGAGCHRLHQGAHAASLHAPPVGLARRLRQRELLGGETGHARGGERPGRAVAHAGGTVRHP